MVRGSVTREPVKPPMRAMCAIVRSVAGRRMR